MEEASRWPREQVAEMVDRLMLALDSAAEPEIELAGRQEARHQLAELENGQVIAVPGKEVSQRIRGMVGRRNPMLFTISWSKRAAKEPMSQQVI